MIQDATNQYIETILAHYDLAGKEVLEIGCGGGRITRDLAGYARRVLATDPDGAAIARAKAAVPAANIEFLQVVAGVPELPAGSFDLVIYTLSLHHVPLGQMTASLEQAGRLLREDGVIMVLEPEEKGPFMEAKRRFGIGSGDESRQQAAALRAMHELAGWTVGETIRFQTWFQFADEEDFFTSKVPGFRQMSADKAEAIRAFLRPYRKSGGIFLAAGRRLNLLRLT
jgi:2-polyprenyl-3-methyl-5-hydroxy-6-metoxy-1,4-benzoquinol methylase